MQNKDSQQPGDVANAALMDTDATDECLGRKLDDYLESLRSSGQSTVENSARSQQLRTDADSSHLATLVEMLSTLSINLAEAPAEAVTMDAPAGYPQLSSDASTGAARSQIGKYQVVRPVGAGGQASAFLCFDPDLRRHVVIKRFRGMRTEAEQQMVFQEGQSLARVRSPYVAQCYHVERDEEGVPYLVVEYIPGSNLFDMHRSKPLGVGQALELTAQAAEGLAAVHACGLLHRDVKPTNIVVGDDGVPRLVDFGLATPVAGDALRSISGTLAYMAPEQARGESERIDQRSDVFGLGAVLYFLLVGEPPYKASNRDALWKAACAGEVIPPSQHNGKLPQSVEELCMKCLAKSPSNRFASALDLERAIRSWQRRHRWLGLLPKSWFGRISAAAAALAVLFVPVIWLLVQPGHSSINPGPVSGLNAGAPKETTLRHPDGRPVRQDFDVQLEPIGGIIDPTGRLLLTDGEKIALKIKSAKDAYVGVWYVPEDGAVVQLFPNKYESNHSVKAGEWRIIPAPELDYHIKAEVSTSAEHILVVASTRFWTPPKNHRGGYVTHESPSEKSDWNDTVRGLTLEPKDGTKEREPEKQLRQVSEVIIPFHVRAK